MSAKHSTGFITSYRWTFTYVDDSDNDTIFSNNQSVPPLKASSKGGTEINVVVLRSVRVTLTVTDTENNSESEKVVINVTPRRWRTKFTSHHGVVPIRGIFSSEQGDSYFVGLNNCTFEAPDPITGAGSGHALHTTKQRSKSKPDSYGLSDPPPPFYQYEDDDIGFAVDQVNDPGGPFHGFWYVKSYKIVVDRTHYVNQTLMPPNGLVYAVNKGDPEHNKSRETLLEAVSIHEHIHSDIMREILQKSDPASMLENYVSGEGDNLRSMADEACRDAESALQEDNYHEQEVHRRLRRRGFDRPGTISLGDENGSEWHIPSIADVGDG